MKCSACRGSGDRFINAGFLKAGRWVRCKVCEGTGKVTPPKPYKGEAMKVWVVRSSASSAPYFVYQGVEKPRRHKMAASGWVYYGDLVISARVFHRLYKVRLKPGEGPVRMVLQLEAV